MSFSALCGACCAEESSLCCRAARFGDRGQLGTYNPLSGSALSPPERSRSNCQVLLIGLFVVDLTLSTDSSGSYAARQLKSGVIHCPTIFTPMPREPLSGVTHEWHERGQRKSVLIVGSNTVKTPPTSASRRAGSSAGQLHRHTDRNHDVLSGMQTQSDTRPVRIGTALVRPESASLPASLPAPMPHSPMRFDRIGLDADWPEQAINVHQPGPGPFSVGRNRRWPGSL